MLKHSKFFVESPYPEVLREILRDPIIQAARVAAPLAAQARSCAVEITGIGSPLLAFHITGHREFFMLILAPPPLNLTIQSSLIHSKFRAIVFPAVGASICGKFNPRYN